MDNNQPQTGSVSTGIDQNSSHSQAANTGPNPIPPGATSQQTQQTAQPVAPEPSTTPAVNVQPATPTPPSQEKPHIALETSNVEVVTPEGEKVVVTAPEGQKLVVVTPAAPAFNDETQIASSTAQQQAIAQSQAVAGVQPAADPNSQSPEANAQQAQPNVQPPADQAANDQNKPAENSDQPNHQAGLVNTLLVVWLIPDLVFPCRLCACFLALYISFETQCFAWHS